jgi:hypothetical protein
VHSWLTSQGFQAPPRFQTKYHGPYFNPLPAYSVRKQDHDRVLGRHHFMRKP